MQLADLRTPCLVLDRTVLDRNIARMQAQCDRLDVALRPHVKTCKSNDVARRTGAHKTGGITVSTLAEARYFAAAGFTDILYAVGIAPGKLDEVAALMADGIDLKVILDDPAAARAVDAFGRDRGCIIQALIEINADDHRAGMEPDGDALIDTARILNQGAGAAFRGVMTHAGESYNCTSLAAIAEMAEQERRAVVTAGDRLRAVDIPCPIVSVGSTPTALFARDLKGVSEIRAGVYMFFDLFQAGLGVCGLDDLALSVLTTVIGHKPAFNRLITDAGGLALSQDRSTQNQTRDCRYGLVADARSGVLRDDLIVDDVNQEHGMLTHPLGPDHAIDFTRYPIGSQLRILPNHACMTAAAHDRYHLVDGDEPTVIAEWPRCHGW